MQERELNAFELRERAAPRCEVQVIAAVMIGVPVSSASLAAPW